MRRPYPYLPVHVLLPADRVSLFVGLLHRQMHHCPIRRGAMPVPLAWLEPDRISRQYFDDGFSVLLLATDA